MVDRLFSAGYTVFKNMMFKAVKMVCPLIILLASLKAHSIYISFLDENGIQQNYSIQYDEKNNRIYFYPANAKSKMFWERVSGEYLPGIGTVMDFWMMLNNFTKGKEVPQSLALFSCFLFENVPVALENSSSVFDDGVLKRTMSFYARKTGKRWVVSVFLLNNEAGSINSCSSLPYCIKKVEVFHNHQSMYCISGDPFSRSRYKRKASGTNTTPRKRMSIMEPLNKSDKRRKVCDHPLAQTARMKSINPFSVSPLAISSMKKK
ncbi:hypothetical protein [Spongorhabdus nitratireducens]